MPCVSSLDHTPWRSGSPHGVFGDAYGFAGAVPLYAVTTSGGAAALWAKTIDVAREEMMSAVRMPNPASRFIAAPFAKPALVRRSFGGGARIIRRPEAPTLLGFTVRFAYSVSSTTRTSFHAQACRIPVDRHSRTRHAGGSVEFERQPRCQTLHDVDGISGWRALVAVLGARPDQ